MTTPYAYDDQRQEMVASQLVARGIQDQQVLRAMASVPRHRFVPENMRHLAYADGPLPIGLAQTISQPYIVALMLQLLQLRGDEVVLEVGTGSGYQAALLAHLAQHVHTIERHSALAASAAAQLKELDFSNVTVHVADGSVGLAALAPFGGIVVAAAAPYAPQPLLEQLAQAAYLVLPVGDAAGQYLQRWQRSGDDYSYEDIVSVAFVPLLGEHGWQEQDWH
ncbi:MAG: protein-L-isoaspartate(D-aspartate) O-methyltransferase [Anaerolineae bacterium]|nr:protein-L-isoaspartate(D-aspartate) O-methyltransferase [Anaerolineae bacterium]